MQLNICLETLPISLEPLASLCQPNFAYISSTWLVSFIVKWWMVPMSLKKIAIMCSWMSKFNKNYFSSFPFLLILIRTSPIETPIENLNVFFLLGPLSGTVCTSVHTKIVHQKQKQWRIYSHSKHVAYILVQPVLHVWVKVCVKCFSKTFELEGRWLGVCSRCHVFM